MADDVPEGQDDSYLLEAQVGHLIRRAHQRHVALFAEHFADADLTPTQWAALAKLRERGTLSQNLLGRLTAMDPATIQGVVRRLGDRGLVERMADPSDRRRSALALSPEGETLVDGLLETAFAASADTLAPLDTNERAVFLEMLARLT